MRITRHPVMWGATLWAAIPIIANWRPGFLLFFGGFLLTALLWLAAPRPPHGRDSGRTLAALRRRDLYAPFAAMLSGRQTWAWANCTGQSPGVWVVLSSCCCCILPVRRPALLSGRFSHAQTINPHPDSTDRFRLGRRDS
ncbi:MAG: hypothetical protein IPN92_20705 [Chromatiaceae bacterium]|nr:hypothetical protein [Chromatiaceae bacterium]